MDHEAYIALGSNLHDPVAQIDHALEFIEQHPNIHLIQSSSKFQNPPVGITEQPNFVNAACWVRTDLSPLDLLDEILDIETTMGRIRSIKNGPRIIDLDLILYDDLKMSHSKLILPHPRMLERSFVVWPILEINRNLVLPDGTLLRSVYSSQPKDLLVVEQESVC